MPYIHPDKRARIDGYLTGLSEVLMDKDSGTLCYALYRLTKEWCGAYSYSYADISAGLAALRDAEHELRRKILDPYEDKQIMKNGDI